MSFPTDTSYGRQTVDQAAFYRLATLATGRFYPAARLNEGGSNLVAATPGRTPAGGGHAPRAGRVFTGQALRFLGLELAGRRLSVLILMIGHAFFLCHGAARNGFSGHNGRHFALVYACASSHHHFLKTLPGRPITAFRPIITNWS